ncbi:T9SS type A sorting domain-containing protein [Flammeovirga sp. MY04]|uniref:PKD domain-containing protein n=1 Tax=Flammeovirga sp. MY04 TaxID=1191459 RepID=UPI0013052E81|nr:carboxypeptidase regulatory-like domain-containing protein [Flammeovirga sp. MY04]ANQ51550.2 T9SS type A sorting domain-containing protein [Flammeovirga sp. MY04]
MKLLYRLQLLLLGLCLLFFGSVNAQTFSGGTGTAGDPYQIATVQDLLDLSGATEMWGAHYQLTADIDMDAQTFTPIGWKDAGTDHTFKGSFDGNYHIIQNLNITPHADQAKLGVGFIGFMQGGTIKNLGLVNVTADMRPEGIERVGGIVGHSEWNATIESCFVVNGNFTATGNVGSIVGYLVANKVNNCFADATINANWGLNGGLVGNVKDLADNGIITNSVFYGTVLRGYPAIVPEADFPQDGRVFDVAGLYSISTTGQENTHPAVTVLTPNAMAIQSNFPDLDFTDTGAWEMRSGSYPVLKGFPATAYDDLPSLLAVPLKVTTDGSTALAGAKVIINGNEYTTTADGTIDAVLVAGTYEYTISADGYISQTDNLEMSEGGPEKVITLIAEGVSTYDAALTIRNNKGNVVEGAEVQLTDASTFDKTLTTDANGQVTFETLVAGTYNYSITKELYIEETGSIEVIDQNISQEIEFTIDNKAPVTMVGDDQIVSTGDVVYLDATGSYDPNGDEMTFEWVEPSGITLSDVSDPAPSFTAPNVDGEEDFVFKLTVSDGVLTSEEVSVTITVKNEIVNGTELLTNGSFEDGLSTGWVGLDAYATSTDVDQEASGTTSLKMETSSKIDGVITSEDAYFPLVIGKKYKFSGRVKVESMNVTVLNFRLMPGGQGNWFDQAKFSMTKPSIDWGDIQPIMNEWMEFEKVITIPEGFSSANIGETVLSQLHIQSSDNAVSEVILLDDLSLVEYDIDFVLSAGDDQTAQASETVSLLASHNSGDDFTFEWTAPDGITLSSTNQLGTSFQVPDVIEETKEYTFTFTATKGSLSVSDEVKVTVTPEVTANAGVNQTVTAGDEVTLDGSQSVPSSATFTWSGPGNIQLSDVNAKQPTFTAPSVQINTDFTFTLNIEYNNVTSSDQVTITVQPDGEFVQPIANAGQDQTVDAGDAVSLDASNSQIQGGTFEWIVPSGITLDDPSSLNPSFTAPEVEVMTKYTFGLKVTAQDIVVVDNVVVTVLPIESEVEDPTSIQDQKKVVLRYFPNPTSGVVTLELNERTEVIILSSMGQVLKSNVLGAGVQKVDLTPYHTGMYIIQLKNSSATTSLKILRQ